MTDTATPSATGAVTGGVRTLLRLEGLALFAGMTLLYAVWDGSWWVYRHPVPGARSQLRGLSGRPADRRHRLQRRPQLPGADGADDGRLCASPQPLVLSIAMIWLAHIGIDRALGYGLKYAAGLASPISAGSAGAI